MRVEGAQSRAGEFGRRRPAVTLFLGGDEKSLSDVATKQAGPRARDSGGAAADPDAGATGADGKDEHHLLPPLRALPCGCWGPPAPLPAAVRGRVSGGLGRCGAWCLQWSIRPPSHFNLERTCLLPVMPHSHLSTPWRPAVFSSPRPSAERNLCFHRKEADGGVGRWARVGACSRFQWFLGPRCPLFSPRGVAPCGAVRARSLRRALCGEHRAQCCTKAITLFFSIVRTPVLVVLRERAVLCGRVSVCSFWQGVGKGWVGG